MHSITIMNNKGGVGKTTCTVHLAGAFARQGRRVLLVDNDSQRNLSSTFWGKTPVDQLDTGETIISIYRGDEPHPGAIIRRTPVDGVDAVPGSRLVNPYTLKTHDSVEVEDQTRLRDFLDGVSDDYDVVLVDCPPTLSLATWSAMVATRWVIAPLKPELYSLEGIPEVVEFIGAIRGSKDRSGKDLNAHISLLGLLLNLMSPTRSAHSVIEKEIRKTKGAEAFNTRIAHNPDYHDSTMCGMPISAYKPKGAAANAFYTLALEIESRIAGRLAREAA